MVLARHWSAAALAADALALALLTMPAQAQSWRDLKCTGNPDIPWTQQIAGCTQAIEVGTF